MARANIFIARIFLKINYRGKTAEGSFGEESVSGDHGDDGALGSDGDVED
jgi:hypothetical protein